MYPLRQIDCTTRFQTRSQYAQTLNISFETMLHLIGDATVLLCRSFQNRVRRDVVDEMLAQVSRKIREAFLAQCLNRAHDRCRVDVVTFRHLARGQEESLLVVVEYLSDQTTAAAAQWRLGETNFKRGE